MPSSRRVGFAVTASIAVALALVLLWTTCAPPGAGPPSGEVAPSASSAPAARPAPARTPRPRSLPAPEPRTEDPGVAPLAGGVSDAGRATGRVRVTVTCEGRPVPDAKVILFSDPPLPAQPVGDAAVWSDGAYFGVPRSLGLWGDARPVLFPSLLRGEVAASETGSDGSVEITAAAGKALAVFVESGVEGFVPRERRGVTPMAGRAIDVAVDVCRVMRITGHCLDDEGRPVADAWIQAIEPIGDRPVSALEKTTPQGAFALRVVGAFPSYRVRAVASRRLPLCDSEAAIPPIPADTTAIGVVPDGMPLEIRMPRTRTVVLDVTAEVPFNHLQVEGLVYEPTANAWGRLGGPVYQRGASDSKHAFAGLPRPDAERPIYLWSWGGPPVHTAFDPRGRDRVTLTMPRSRKVTVKGRGWAAGDRIRVVCRLGSPGEEIPVIWVENDVTGCSEWSRDDAPPCEVEFRLVRGGREIGARPSVPAGPDEAPAVRIDL